MTSVKPNSELSHKRETPVSGEILYAQFKGIGSDKLIFTRLSREEFFAEKFDEQVGSHQTMTIAIGDINPEGNTRVGELEQNALYQISGPHPADKKFSIDYKK